MATASDVYRSYDVEEIRLLLVGESGVGKSSTGNSILNKRGDKSQGIQPAFHNSCSSASVTKFSQYEFVERFGKRVVVVDTPGIFDTSKTNGEIEAELLRTCALLSPGFHALVFVVQAGRKFEQSKKTIDFFFQTFSECVSEYTIILVTRWDEIREEMTSFDEYIETFPDELKKMIRSCGGRVLPMNNKATAEENERQVTSLIGTVEKMQNEHGKSCYPHVIFQAVDKFMKYGWPSEDRQRPILLSGEYSSSVHSESATADSGYVNIFGRSRSVTMESESTAAHVDIVDSIRREKLIKDFQNPEKSKSLLARMKEFILSFFKRNNKTQGGVV